MDQVGMILFPPENLRREQKCKIPEGCFKECHTQIGKSKLATYRGPLLFLYPKSLISNKPNFPKRTLGEKVLSGIMVHVFWGLSP